MHLEGMIDGDWAVLEGDPSGGRKLGGRRDGS